MNLINIWIVLSTTAKNAVNTALNTPEDEYNGPVTVTERRIFERMADNATVQRMFRAGTFAGKTWHLYSLNFNLSGNQASKLRNALDYLAANRAGNFRVVGAWHWDGRQVGTQFTYDVDGNVTGVTGTPTYPIPTTQLLKLMPDDVDRTDPNNPVFTPATQLKQVNTIQGQRFRRFA